MVCLTPEYMYLPKTHPITQFAEAYEHQFRKAKMTPQKGYYQCIRPCNHCIGCYLDHANEWATRIFCELMTSDQENTCFATFTYDNPHLPWTQKAQTTLVTEHTQKLWHDLRQKYPNLSIRYVIAGEYGMTGTRAVFGGNPHYHAIIFGYKPKDLEFYRFSKVDKTIKLYKSKSLKKIWGKGMVIIGEVNYKSACYVARYVNKKVKNRIKKQTDWNNPKNVKEWEQSHYYTLDYNSEFLFIEDVIKYNDFFNLHMTIGQITTIAQSSMSKKTYHKIKDETEQKEEFILSSKKPAIGLNYWLQNKEEIKKNSGIFVNFQGNVKLKQIPRYFKKKWQEENWEEYQNWAYKQIKNYEEQKQKLINQLHLEKYYLEEQKEEFLRKLNAENLKLKTNKLTRENFA